jgi:hypothetical protein
MASLGVSAVGQLYTVWRRAHIMNILNTWNLTSNPQIQGDSLWRWRGGVFQKAHLKDRDVLHADTLEKIGEWDSAERNWILFTKAVMEGAMSENPRHKNLTL